MSQAIKGDSLTKLKKFKKNVEEYMKGRWLKQWSGIQPAKKARRRIKFVADARDKKDFEILVLDKDDNKDNEKSSSFRLEKIKGTENHHSVRLVGEWRCFFIWENNEAWEIDISNHEYKKVRR